MAFGTSRKVPIYVCRTYFADVLSPRLFRWYLFGWYTLYIGHSNFRSFQTARNLSEGATRSAERSWSAPPRATK